MKNRNGQIAALAFLGLGTAALGGCVTAQEPVPTVSSSTVVVSSAAPVQRAYTYREGRYELRGDGTTASPYYWVWIPAGATVATVPAPPVVVQQEVVPSASPPTLVVTPAAPQRLYAYPQGRYELRGDGTAFSPYYWVWIPTGATVVPPPPPLPR